MWTPLVPLNKKISFFLQGSLYGHQVMEIYKKRKFFFFFLSHGKYSESLDSGFGGYYDSLQTSERSFFFFECIDFSLMEMVRISCVLLKH